MNITVENQTLGSFLREVTHERRHATFVMCEDDTRTYEEFLTNVDAYACGLLACGVKPGDKVALWAGNCVEWVELYFAVVSIGATLVTVNTRLRAEELHYELAQSESAYVILQSDFLKEDLLVRLKEAAPEISYQPYGAIVSESLPRLRGAITFEESDLPGTISLAELIERGHSVTVGAYHAALSDAHPEDTALIIYTSGTTGAPKGVEQSHRALLGRMSRFCEWNNMDENDSTFFALPLFHSFGAVVAVIGTLVTGSRLCMLEKFRPKEALSLIQEQRCSVIHGVPSSFYMMLKDPEFSSFDLSCGRTGVLGGAPCPPWLAAEIMDKIAPSITAAWGQTETCGMVTASAPDDTPEQVCETVGRVIPGSEVVIVDTDTGQEVPQGTCGEVLVISDDNMKGYYHMEEQTRKVFDEQGRLHTGDLGYFDADGCLRINGRIRDMMIIGGVNVYPVEIENCIRTMNGIEDVQVVGVPDDRMGEVACAYLMVADGADVTEEAVKAHCNVLASYKVPRYVRILDEFPMTANGKVKKYVLRDMFTAQ